MSKDVYTIDMVENVRKQLDENFQQIEGELRERAEYFLPRSTRFLSTDVNKTRKKIVKIKDSIVNKAVRNFSAGMMTGICNPASNWFSCSIKGFEFEQDHEASLFCSNSDKLLYAIISGSNFYKHIPVVLKHSAVFSMGVLYCEHDYERVVNTKVVPIGSYRYSKNQYGEVDTFVRVFMETSKNLVDTFGIDNVSKAVKREVENKKYNELHEIVHFVAPNKEFMPNSPFAKNKKFCSLYYETSGNDGKFLRKSGYNKLPYIVFESDTNGEDVYPSNCPASDALPDVKQLMEMVIDEGKAIKKIVSPVTKGPSSLKNKISSDKAGTYIEEDAQGRGISTVYEVNPAVLGVHDIIEIKKKNIEEHFYNDIFTTILQTAERNRTAFEVSELKEEKMSLLAEILTQMLDGLRRFLEWLFQECYESNILPDVPQSIVGRDLDIEFNSMLAQAQKTVKVGGIERFSTFIANMANAYQNPHILKKFDVMKSIDNYCKLANLSPDLLVATDEVQKQAEIENQQMQQKQQQAEAMQALQQGGEFIKNMGGSDAFKGELMARLGAS